MEPRRDNGEPEAAAPPQLDLDQPGAAELAGLVDQGLEDHMNRARQEYEAQSRLAESQRPSLVRSKVECTRLLSAESGRVREISELQAKMNEPTEMGFVLAKALETAANGGTSHLLGAFSPPSAETRMLLAKASKKLETLSVEFNTLKTELRKAYLQLTKVVNERNTNFDRFLRVLEQQERTIASQARLLQTVEPIYRMHQIRDERMRAEVAQELEQRTGKQPSL